jgi:hypothetical protein
MHVHLELEAGLRQIPKRGIDLVGGVEWGSR